VGRPCVERTYYGVGRKEDPSEEPGPGDSDGVGHAVVKVFEMKVCYALAVKHIKPATDAHIHLGFRGSRPDCGDPRAAHGWPLARVRGDT
jgi:hypothetical protein